MAKNDCPPCCGCCQCFNRVLKRFDCPCCDRYFPEWQVGASWWLFLVRTAILIFFTTLASVGASLWTERIFETARITFGSGFIISLFMTNTIFLMLLYGPYLVKTYPIWFTVVVAVIYVGLGLFLFIEQLIRGNLQQFETDSINFDIWTVIHFLAGPFFALCLPLVWMTLIVVAWEIMEAYTYGFGESETLGNRAIDVGVAIIGWFMVILAFKHTRKQVPWLSAMARAGNSGEPINWPRLWNRMMCCKNCEGCKLKAVDPEETELETVVQIENQQNGAGTQITTVSL